MKQVIKTTICFVSLVFVGVGTNAQTLDRSVVSGSGGALNNSNLQMTFTLGEVLSSQMKTSSATLTNGFQQSFKDTTGSVRFPSLRGNLKAYPNPVHNTLYIESDIDLEIEVINVSGKVIEKHTFQRGHNELTVNSYARGIYLVRGMDSSGGVRTIRIAKY